MTNQLWNLWNHLNIGLATENDWIKVYRSVKPGAGIKAAQWAKAYKDSDKTYLVTLNLKSEIIHIVPKLSIKLINMVLVTMQLMTKA